jgi:hypothetical protein
LGLWRTAVEFLTALGIVALLAGESAASWRLTVAWLQALLVPGAGESLSIAPLVCTLGASAVGRLYTLAAMPVLAGAAAALLGVIKQRCREGARSSAVKLLSRKQRATIKALALLGETPANACALSAPSMPVVASSARAADVPVWAPAAFAVVFWLYPTLAMAAVQAFRCTEEPIGFHKYLLADLGQACGNAEHIAGLVLAGLVVLPTVAAVPLLCLAVAWMRLRSALQGSTDALKGPEAAIAAEPALLPSQPFVHQWLMKVDAAMSALTAAPLQGEPEPPGPFASLASGVMFLQRLSLALAAVVPSSRSYCQCACIIVLAVQLSMQFLLSTPASSFQHGMRLFSCGGTLLCSILLVVASTPPPISASGNAGSSGESGTSADFMGASIAVPTAVAAAFFLLLSLLVLMLMLLAHAWWQRPGERRSCVSFERLGWCKPSQSTHHASCTALR